MPPISILIIDDEPMNFDVIEAFLRSGGGLTLPLATEAERTVQDYQLHYASSGEKGIAALKSCFPDLILLDVMMPGENGIEICKQIRAIPQYSTIPIIMVTALTAKKDLAACLAAGANDFISKPINCLELRARVGSMLRIRQQYQKIETLNEQLGKAVRHKTEQLKKVNVSLDEQINERLILEQESRLSESQFRVLMASVSDLLFLIHCSGEVYYANPASHRNFGYSPLEIINHSFKRWIHPQDHATADHFLSCVINNPGSPLLAKLRWLTQDGDHPCFETIAQRVDGEVGLSGIVLHVRGVKDCQQYKTWESVFSEETRESNLCITSGYHSS